MDLPGTILIIAAQVVFLLAMQWGGATKSWESGAVVTTLVLSVILLVAFAVIEVFQGERSLLVPRLLKQRNTAACCVFIFL
jgi:MFS transporter, DHA2 family, glioxin efflux transporter